MRSDWAGSIGTKIAPAPQTTKQTEIARYFATRFIGVRKALIPAIRMPSGNPILFRPY